MGWATLSAAANRVAFDRLGSVSVVAGAVSGRGFLYMPGEYVADGRVISTEYTLRVEAAKFGSLSYNCLITVDDVAFVVREAPLLVDDGVFCVLLLTKAQGNEEYTYILDGDFL